MKSPKFLGSLLTGAFVVLVLLTWFEPGIRLFFSRSRVAPYRFVLSPIGDLQPYIDDLKKRIERDPTTGLHRAALASIYVAKAKVSGDETYYDLAKDLALKSLQLLPASNPQAKLVLAQIASAQHRFNECIQLGEEVLKEKEGAEVFSILSTAHLAQGTLNEGLVFADRLVDGRPSLSAYGLRALILQAAGRDKEAEYDFRHGLSLEDAGDMAESSRVRVLYARFLLKWERLAEAEDLLKEALRIIPDSPLALNQMGELELHRENYKEASSLFMRAFTASRQNLYFHHYGKAQLLAGNTANAKKVYDEAEKNLRSELARNSYGHRAELAQLLIEREDKEKLADALALLKEELKTRQSGEVLKIYALALEKEELWREGKATIQRILRLGLRDPGVYRMAAVFEEKVGNLTRSEMYRKLSETADF